MDTFRMCCNTPCNARATEETCAGELLCRPCLDRIFGREPSLYDECVKLSRRLQTTMHAPGHNVEYRDALNATWKALQALRRFL